MPIYEYRCNHCGHQFERLQKISDPDPERCPECGVEGEVSRLISPVGFRLKGGGWYETDFKKGNRRNVAGEGEQKAKPAAAEAKDAPAGKDKAAEAGKKPPAKSGSGSGGKATA